MRAREKERERERDGVGLGQDSSIRHCGAWFVPEHGTTSLLINLNERDSLE